MFYTYAHIRNDTNKIFYIGKGKGNRAFSSTGRNPFWKSIVEKHGHKVEILANWKTEQEAFDHEMLLISCFKDMGYKLSNMTIGGEGASGVEWTEKRKEKHSKRMSGEGNPRFGNSHTKETKLKLSIASKAKIGNKNAFFGKSHNQTTKEKIKQARSNVLGKDANRFKGYIVATNILSNEKIVFAGRKALVDFGFGASMVYNCLNGKRNKHKGHTFERIYGKVPPLSATPAGDK
jgi:hypothetical protein